MKIRIALAALCSAVVLLLSGCGSNNFRDLEHVPSKDPDTAVVYNNVDLNPNITKLCIEGLAFITTTRDYDNTQRVPEWDATCPKTTTNK